MEFFNEIWLKVGEHEYIYIFEIKFAKKIILFQNGSLNKLIVTLCNNANHMLISVKMVQLVQCFK